MAGELIPSNPVGGEFGTSVATDGNTVVAGEPYNGTAGAAYVYTEPASGWTNMTETVKLYPDVAGTYFGMSAAVAGSTAVVGGGQTILYGSSAPAAPTVTGVSPSSGAASGNTTVTITGTGFTGATAVAFGGLAAKSYTVNSDTQITATSPGGSGTVDIKVTGPNGTSVPTSNDHFTYVAASLPANLGVFSGGYWYRDMNGDDQWTAADGSPIQFGWAGATPVVGDWDGSGKTEIGVYNDGTWWLDTTSGVETFTFGFPSSPGNLVIPVVGDWNGDGKTEVGVYCNGAWFRDVDGTHTWGATNQAALAYLGWNDGGTGSVVPVPGYWAGDGKTEMGVYCNGVWFLDSTGSGKYDGTYSYWGWYSPNSPLVPVAGDWGGTGTKDQFAVYNQGVWFRDVDGTHQWDATNQAAVAYFGWAGRSPWWATGSTTPVPPRRVAARRSGRGRLAASGGRCLTGGSGDPIPIHRGHVLRQRCGARTGKPARARSRRGPERADRFVVPRGRGHRRRSRP